MTQRFKSSSDSIPFGLRFRQKFGRHTVFTVTTMIMALIAMGFLSACGSSSGGGSSDTAGETITALSLPSRIELTKVDSSGDTSAHIKALGVRTAHATKYSVKAFDSADTDYSTAQKNTWVDDTNALDMVNDVLGVVKDTAYDQFVNAGPYKALVRKVGDSQQSQSGASTTSTTTENLMEIIVDVTRASNSDPMIVKVWVYEDDDMPKLIRGYFTVTQGVSDAYPFGEMEAHFKGMPLDENGEEVAGNPLFTMAMSVSADDDGNVVIENVENGADQSEGDYQWNRKVRVVANDQVTQGNAYVYNQETEWDEGLGENVLPDPTILQIAFNDGYFKATEQGSDPVVFDKNNLRHRVFRYQLFDATTGDAITRDSGFPIETTDQKHGYVGYYGLWEPYGTTIANGDTVTDMDGNPFTVFRAAGKLTRHTRASMPLSDLTGVELSKWTNDGDTIVTWTGTQFNQIGTRNQQTGQIVYADGGAVTFQQWEGAWCEPMKAYLNLGTLYFNPEDGSPATPSNTSTVYYHAEETITPNDANIPTTLYTWSFTLATPITQTVIDNAQTNENNYWQDPNSQVEKAYYFDSETMMLYADAAHTVPVVIADDVNLDGTNYQNGYNIGPLTTDSYTHENSWQANEAQVFYTWNTGSDPWNQYVTVKDGNGVFETFEAPLTFTYTHSTANDLNGSSKFDGKKFRIEYDGFSVNIPWDFEEESGEWKPQINIKDGTLMGPNNEYVIKGVEECLKMTKITDPAVLAGITIDDYVTEGVAAPTLTYDATKTALVGDPPAAELQVIKGEPIAD